MGEEHECCKLSSWFQNSTPLYLEFYLWSIYIQKIKEQIRKICYKLPRSRKAREVKTPHCKCWNYQMNPAIRSSWKHHDITFWQPNPLCAAQTFYPICSNYVGGTHREKPTATQFVRLLFSMTHIFVQMRLIIVSRDTFLGFEGTYQMIDFWRHEWSAPEML